MTVVTVTFQRTEQGRPRYPTITDDFVFSGNGKYETLLENGNRAIRVYSLGGLVYYAEKTPRGIVLCCLEQYRIETPRWKTETFEIDWDVMKDCTHEIRRCHGKRHGIRWQWFSEDQPPKAVGLYVAGKMHGSYARGWFYRGVQTDKDGFRALTPEPNQLAAVLPLVVATRTCHFL